MTSIRADALDIELDTPPPLVPPAEHDTLTVRGERPYPYASNDGATVHRIERGFGRFERALRVPAGLDPDAVQASMTDAVLALHIPKPGALKPHKIEVKAAAPSGDRELADTTAS
jgi:HSP20 family protein